MKTLVEISSKHEKEYEIPDYLFNPIINAYNNFRLLYPKGSFWQFYKMMDKVFKKGIKVKEFKRKPRNRGSRISIVYLDEMINL